MLVKAGTAVFAIIADTIPNMQPHVQGWAGLLHAWASSHSLAQVQHTERCTPYAATDMCARMPMQVVPDGTLTQAAASLFGWVRARQPMFCGGWQRRTGALNG